VLKDRIIWGIIAAILLIIVALADAWVLKLTIVAVILVAISEIYTLTAKKSFTIFIFSSSFIALCFSCVAFVRMSENGSIMVWLIFCGAFLTDTFAYIFGLWLGKGKNHFLAPKISPKKTIEGSIGAIIGTTLVFSLSSFFMQGYPFNLNFIKVSILGLLLSILAQIGDLMASMLKRKFGAKDYGSIQPGHGGIMDRCDSLLIVAPFVYFYINLIGVFN